MDKITFETLPAAVTQLWQKLNDIEQLLLNVNAHTPTETDQLLTIDEAAQLIKLTKPTIYGLVSKSEIPVNKKGKRLYFSKQELIEWVMSGRKKTHSEMAADADNFLTKNSR